MPRVACHVITVLAAVSVLACTALCSLGVEVRHPVRVGGLLVWPIGWSSAWGWHVYRRIRVVRRRRGAGQCIGCGYDLRATPDRCPECGRIPDGDLG
jgi:hypothetical protein